MLGGFLLLMSRARCRRGGVQERYGRRSTMITSQLPLDKWHEIIGDPTYADAILDRLVHNAHRIELVGESMRRTRGKQNQKA
jgi:DNA replication protein DnaC